LGSGKPVGNDSGVRSIEPLKVCPFDVELFPNPIDGGGDDGELRKGVVHSESEKADRSSSDTTAISGTAFPFAQGRIIERFDALFDSIQEIRADRWIIIEHPTDRSDRNAGVIRD
jgi:hypothetical protein